MRGAAPTPELLCGDSPELLDELRARLAALGQVDALLRQGDGPTADWLATGTGKGERCQGPLTPSLSAQNNGP